VGKARKGRSDAKRPDTEYLYRRHLTWWLRDPVPRPLWGVLGKRRIEVSLHTHSLKEARRLRTIRRGENQRLFEAARKGIGDPTTEALNLRQWGKGLDDGPDAPIAIYDAAELEADRIKAAHGEDAASSFYRAATGTGTPIQHHADAWLRESKYRPRSQDQHRGILREFVGWCGADKTAPEIEAITQRAAGRFVSTAAERGADHGTINRKLSTLRAYWKWLVKRGHAEANPWLGQSLPKAQDGDEAKKSRAYKPDELLALLTGDTDATLAAFIRIGALTGMRIETIAQLRVADCAGGVFNIRRDKTAAGVRKVPIHSTLQPFVSAQCEGRAADAWLFPELTATKRGDRASAISKRFYTYRIGLGIDDTPAGQRRSLTTFHSFRNTFITAAVNAGQDWDVAQQIVGHKLQKGATSDHYFGGYVDPIKKACVEAVRLPEGIPPLVVTVAHPVPPQDRQSRNERRPRKPVGGP
jgi:integrase